MLCWMVWPWTIGTYVYSNHEKKCYKDHKDG